MVLIYEAFERSNAWLIFATISVPNTVHPRELAYADFNGDGKLDIFIADHGWDTNPYPGGQNQLILSTSNGWEVASSKLPQRQDFTHSTAVGDINNDGNVDIFVGNVNTGTSAYSSSVLLGDGKGGFTESTALLPLEIQGANATGHFHTQVPPSPFIHRQPLTAQTP